MGFLRRAKAQVYADPYDPEDVDADREPNKSLARRQRELKYAMLAAVEFHQSHETHLRTFVDGVEERNLQNRKQEWLRNKKRELRKLGLPIKAEELVQAVEAQEAIGFPPVGRATQAQEGTSESAGSNNNVDVDDDDKDDDKMREFLEHEEILAFWEQSAKQHRDAFEQAMIAPLEEVFNSKNWKAGAVQARKRYLELLARPQLKGDAVTSLSRAVSILDVYRELNTRFKKEAVDQADREQREETALKTKLARLNEELRILELHKQARSIVR